jgi:hypothetical protein
MVTKKLEQVELLVLFRQQTEQEIFALKMKIRLLACTREPIQIEFVSA